jgi:hypothetical protein
MASADSSLCASESSIYEANLVTILPQDVIEKLAELDLELSEGKQLSSIRKECANSAATSYCCPIARSNY